MTTPCVILIEFNELCPDLMDKFISQRLLPNFAKFRSESEVYVTDAEAEGEELNPWVQWVTVHSGLSHKEHQVLHLSQGHLLETKAVWDVLSDAGFKVWVCSSMNPRVDTPINGFLLPDPWSTGVRPQPVEEFGPFLDYVRAAVQEHTVAQQRVNSRQFLAYMLSHGLSFRTICNTIYQLASERFGDFKWKRAGIMDQLQFDLFQHCFRKHRPHFSTFFANSTAHFQHCYWRHMEPERFGTQLTEKELRTYGGAVQFGYESMDRLIGRFFRVAPQNATLIFCTALSQQPYLDYEQAGGRHYYHLRQQQDLRDVFGVSQPFENEPVMAEQFLLRFKTANDLAAAKQQLASFHLSETSPFANGNPQLFHLASSGDVALMCQCRATGEVSAGATISGCAGEESIPFYKVFYRFSTTKSARHHPDGLLWIRRPSKEHKVHEQKLSLQQIAPMILESFGLSWDSHGPVAEKSEAAKCG